MARRTASRGGVTAAQHSFARVPAVGGQRSVFNRSFNLKTAFDAGWLIPIYLDEALPGDTLNMKMSSFCRLATPIFPVMDNMYMDFFFFAVPNRILWENWVKFCGEQRNPGDSIEFTVPQRTYGSVAEDSLEDYFGIPEDSAGGVTINMLHHRAYNMIWNEWFRDENLQDQVFEEIGDTSAGSSNWELLRRGKRHDYFTSCLPFPQKGAAILLPIGAEAPVLSEAAAAVPGTGIPIFDGGNWANNDLSLVGASGVADAKWAANAGSDPAEWSDTQLFADLSTATGATINSLREAFQVQRIFERDARAGTRYTEIIRSHFQISSDDARLQRPEYLGGGSTKINISPVAVTAAETGREIGDLAGFGTQSASGIGFVKSFTEHCVLLGFVNVRADISYQEGLDRMWSRQKRFDYYWPSLAHLGEQAVLNKEIVHTGTPATDDAVFGYQERWAEYRYKASLTTGQMRSSALTSLDSWHLALDFAGGVPPLNATFIEDNPPIARVIAVPAEPHFIGDFWFQYKCARPMPTYSVPGMIDHF